MITLKLFNAVLAKPFPAPTAAPQKSEGNEVLNFKRIHTTLPLGFVVAPSAAHKTKKILTYYKRENLTSNQLNATFHKSWKTVQQQGQEKRMRHQFLHYLSTYGREMMDLKSDFIYFPDEPSFVPAVRKQPVRVIHGFTADELAERALTMLNSGVALHRDTVDDLMKLFVAIDRLPAVKNDIRNREFQLLLEVQHGVLPTKPVELLRLLIFLATRRLMLIKDGKTIRAIQRSEFDPTDIVHQFGIEKASSIFLRFKSLWLAFKRGPGSQATRTINRMSKLARKHHRPLPVDYLNAVTSLDQIDYQQLRRALGKVNTFRKIRLLYALHTRLADGPFRMYRVRNGKSIAVAKPNDGHRYAAWDTAFQIVWDDLAATLPVEGQTFLMSQGVHLALPATEKMFIGNLPVGTQVIIPDGLTVGIYWENDWGARDLDLSANGLYRVGWNASYNTGGVTYSGDVTNAPEGATELLRFGKQLPGAFLVNVNIYSGNQESSYKLFVGQSARVEADHMLDPSQLFAEVKLTTVSRQQIAGLVQSHPKGNRFVFCNSGAGNFSVSSRTGAGQFGSRLALADQWSDAPLLEDLLTAAGATVTRDPSQRIDHDLRWENLAKDSVLKLFA